MLNSTGLSMVLCPEGGTDEMYKVGVVVLLIGVAILESYWIVAAVSYTHLRAHET